MTKTIGVIVGIIILVGGIYWLVSTTNSNPGTTPVDQSSQTVNQVPQDIPVLAYSTSTPGGARITAVGNGMTLYTFKSDSYNTSTCTDGCAQTWPPYTIPTSGTLTSNGMAGLISTITRPDGTLQVTYNGMPLYFYSKDLTPGDTKGKSIPGWSVAVPADQTGS